MWRVSLQQQFPADFERRTARGRRDGRDHRIMAGIGE